MLSDESQFEKDACIRLFKELNYNHRNIKREPSDDVILKEEFINSVIEINNTSREVAERVYNKFTTVKQSEVKRENKHKYQMMTTESVKVKDINDEISTYQLIDYNNVGHNKFTVTTQYEVKYGGKNGIPDIVVFINGIPISIFELKDATENSASLKSAYSEVTDTYKSDIPNLFYYNQIVCLASPTKARVGSFTSNWEWYLPWNYVSKEGDTVEEPEYRTLIKGLFNKERLLEIIRDFILYDTNNNKFTPAYYQYYGVKKAVNKTKPKLNLNSSENPESRRIGLVSHCQGSGKSISIAYYINKVRRESLSQPLFVTLTDEKTLDNQISDDILSNFGFNSHQCKSISDLRNKIRERKVSGDIISSTIQKFDYFKEEKCKNRLKRVKLMYNSLNNPKPDTKKKIDVSQKYFDKNRYNDCVKLLDEIEDNINIDELGNEFQDCEYDVSTSDTSHPVLNDRSDIIVISDEAHRSQDKNLGQNVREALPNASQIGFTATPVYDTDNITEEWFGQEISTYRIDQAEKDGSVLPVDYENRAPEVNINEEKLETLFKEKTKDKDLDYSRGPEVKDVLKSQERIEKISKDIVDYYNKREQEYNGNCILVTVDRETAVRYERELNSLLDDKEAIAVISNKDDLVDGEIAQENNLKKRFKTDKNDNKDNYDKFCIAIVVDKWTTGFNCPKLHTIFLDKPMRGHNIVQAAGRVNRVSDGKVGSRMVDYVGIRDVIEDAFSKYTTDYENNSIEWNLDEKIKEFKQEYNRLDEKIDFDNYSNYRLYNQDRKNIIMDDELSRFDNREMRKLCSIFDDMLTYYRRIHPCDETRKYNDGVMFFSELVGRMKSLLDIGDPEPGDNSEIKEIIRESIESEEAVQIDTIESGNIIESISNPDLDIMRAKNAVEKKMQEKNTYNKATFERIKEDLEDIIKKYNNGRITSEKAMKDIKDKNDDVDSMDERAKDLGLNVQELTFYDILEHNTKIDKVERKEISKRINDFIHKHTYTDWKKRSKIENKLSSKIIDILEDNVEDENIIIDVKEQIIEQAKDLY